MNSSPSSSLASQIPYMLFVVSLFLVYGALVRRGVVAGWAILGVGVVVGAAAVTASFFNIPLELRREMPPLLIASGPGAMALCAAFCVAFAFRAQKVVDLASFSLGDTTVIVRYSPAARLDADALILPTSTGLRMRGGVAGALAVAGGPGIETEARAKAPIGIGKVVATGGGRLAVDRVFHAAVSAPGSVVEAAALRRGLEAALGQARKSGAETLVVPIGGLRGLSAGQVATVAAEALLKQRSAFSQIVFAALDLRGGETVRRAVEAVVVAGAVRP